MEPQLHKKYGLPTAIAMVVGIVIGSGVFFKGEKILTATGGDLRIGILAWLIGGAIMVICAYVFSILATRHAHVSGIVDYAEAALGPRYGYFVGWFMAVIYYPTLTAALAWVSARYTCVLAGFDIAGPEAMVLSGVYLIGSYALNALSPVLAGKFQVTTTVVKLIPLALMGVVGTAMGLASGMTVHNFTTVVHTVPTGNALLTAVVATSFAYEGWIIATSINAEIKDAKKNLPRALVAGSCIVVFAYILYYVGLAGGVSNEVMMQSGETGARIAFEQIFSRLGGALLFVFVVISCLGTLNGLMLGCTRGLYALAARGRGPAPRVFRQVDPATNMPTNAAVFGLLVCACWLLYFYGSQLTESWFGRYGFDMTELPIITIYAAYLPIFVALMRRGDGLSAFRRYLMPALAILACLFMMLAACIAHRMEVVWYLAVFAAVMAIGACFSIQKPESDQA